MMIEIIGNLMQETVNELSVYMLLIRTMYEKVQVGKDQENAQSEKDSHSKNQGGKKPN